MNPASGDFSIPSAIPPFSIQTHDQPIKSSTTIQNINKAKESMPLPRKGVTKISTQAIQAANASEICDRARHDSKAWKVAKRFLGAITLGPRIVLAASIVAGLTLFAVCAGIGTKIDELGNKFYPLAIGKTTGVIRVIFGIPGCIGAAIGIGSLKALSFVANLTGDADMKSEQTKELKGLEFRSLMYSFRPDILDIL